MIKKTKLFGIFFSVNILLPFNLLAVSCSKTKTESDATSTSSVSESERESQSFSDGIKDFVKKGIAPQGNQSILTIDDLLNEIGFTDTQQAKLAKLKETETFLDQLADSLNKNIEDEDFKVELKNNKVVEEGIKKIIHKNCERTSGLLKKNYGDEFAEASVSKILELEEGSLIFNLKKFSLSKIFRDIEDEDLKFDEAQKDVFAESDKLKIYNINIDLTTNLSDGNSKKMLLLSKI